VHDTSHNQFPDGIVDSNSSTALSMFKHLLQRPNPAARLLAKYLRENFILPWTFSCPTPPISGSLMVSG
jgi:hypothetical protein